jgi:Ca2+-transporting ATPase
MIGLATTNAPIDGLTLDQSKIEVGQTMAFVTLALLELVHVFNVRDNKKSIFKTKVFNNSKLLLAVAASALLIFIILFIPALRDIFSIPVLPVGNALEIAGLLILPLIVVEVLKALKINTAKDE